MAVPQPLDLRFRRWAFDTAIPADIIVRPVAVPFSVRFDVRAFLKGDNGILAEDKSRYADYTGCGNTLNANEPIVRRLILDSLRYWVSEMRNAALARDRTVRRCGRHRLDPR